MHFTASFRRAMLGTVAAGAMFAFGTAAQADTIFFAPGAAQAGANVNFMTAICGGIGCTAADLDSPTKVDEFGWASVNDIVVGNGTGDEQTWRINISTTTPGVISVGDTFTEVFSFHLVQVKDLGGSEEVYGNGSGTFRSHVVMKATLSGVVAAIGAQPSTTTVSGPIVTGDGPLQDGLVLDYTAGYFDWFFDPDAIDDDDIVDGEFDDGFVANADDEIHIAKFKLIDGSGSAAGDDYNLDWTAEFVEALPGVFFDGALNELANGADGSVAGFKQVTTPQQLVFKVTEQNVALEKETGTDISLFATSSGTATGTTVVNIKARQIPEPATLSLLGLGLVGLGALARRRRA